MLSDVCADLASDLLDVVIASRGLDLPVHDVVLHDPSDRPASGIGIGDIVLGVGTAGDRHGAALVDGCGRAGGVAVVLRRSDRMPDALMAMAEESGVAILTTNPEVAWGHLYVLIRTSIAAATSAGLPRVTGPGLGDLFALADATAAVARGPVTIEDPQNRVLAFSRDGQDIDDGRRATVLGRQVPELWVAALRQAGTLDRLASTDDVVRTEIPNGYPRRAIAIRAAGTLLGSIWLVEVPSVSSEADVALREAARVAALHLLRYRVADDLDRRVRGGMLSSLLRGDGPVGSTLERLGLAPDQGFVVMAIEFPHRDDAPLLRERLLDLVVMHLQTYRRKVAATEIGERIYVLARSHDECDRAALRDVVDDCVVRARDALEVEVRVGIGQRAGHAGELGDSHRSADQCLELGAPEARVIGFEEIHGQAILADVQSYLSQRRHGVSRELHALREHDARHGSEYLHTLRVFLDALGDIAAASAPLHVHPNTLRYRLRRIQEIAPIDLGDPDARFALELQLRTMPDAD